jgi:anthranilate synthase component 2
MILILDNYDSFTYNLVHLIASTGCDYEVWRNDKITVSEVMKKQPQGILISPGPGRPEDAGITNELIREAGKTIPVLGVCLGHQAIGQVFGATVTHAPKLMHGKTSPISHDGKSVFENLPVPFLATRYHSLVLDPETIPDELEISAHSNDDVIQGVRHKTLPIEGIQFHPESILTKEGPGIIKNWVTKSLTLETQIV